MQTIAKSDAISVKTILRLVPHKKGSWPSGVPAAIVLLGLSLRAYGINFGLPYTIAPDEPNHFSIALRMFVNGDLNPHWLNYPSLMFDLNALALVAYYWLGKIAGVFSVPSDIPFPEVVTMGVGRLAMPSEFLLSRGLTALVGAASIILVYKIGRTIHSGKEVAVMAALLFAVSPANVYNSHLIRPDTLAVFFVLFSCFWAMRIPDDGRLRNYVLSGIGAGLAVSSKYNMPLVIVPMIVAHLMRYKGWDALRHKAVYLGIASSALAFLLTTPFAILDIGAFLRDMGFEVAAQAAGHAGFEGNTLPWYTSFIWTTEGLVGIAAVVQAVRLVLNRSAKSLVLLSFPISYFVFINFFVVRNDRTLLPVLPFMEVLASLAVVDAVRWGVARFRTGRREAAIVLTCFSLVFIAQPLLVSLAQDVRLTQPDGRDAARLWLESNLPANSRVMEESYSPYIDTSRYLVQGVFGMIDHSPDWYSRNGFEYLVLSEGNYGRYFAEPDRYPVEYEKYKQLFASFPQAAIFGDNGYEVRVLRTGAKIPPYRVGARFGEDGQLIELVGFDLPDAKWIAGQPLRLEVTWRGLSNLNQPLDVSLRLLDHNDKEVGFLATRLQWSKGADGDGGGMFTSKWTVPVTGDSAPGLYRVGLELTQAKYGYRAPAFTWRMQQIDPVLLGPIKQSSSVSEEELRGAQTTKVTWSDKFSLEGYKPPGNPVHAGETVALTLYWKALEREKHDYTVFVHLIDSNGVIKAQADGQPMNGDHPTSLWELGEIVRDVHSVKLPPDLAPGTYRLEIGLYSWPDLKKLESTDASTQTPNDHWVVPEPILVY